MLNVGASSAALVRRYMDPAFRKGHGRSCGRNQLVLDSRQAVAYGVSITLATAEQGCCDFSYWCNSRLDWASGPG